MKQSDNNKYMADIYTEIFGITVELDTSFNEIFEAFELIMNKYNVRAWAANENGTSSGITADYNMCRAALNQHVHGQYNMMFTMSRAMANREPYEYV